VSSELAVFPFLIDACSIANHVVSLTYCVLDSDRPVILLRDRELASSRNLVWLATVFLWWTGGKGCPSDLVLKFGGPITFDSRLGGRSLVQVWFWAFWRSFGGSVVARWWKLNDHLMWLGVGDEDWVHFYKGVLWGE
jgi:hypothetical protein